MFGAAPTFDQGMQPAAMASAGQIALAVFSAGAGVSRPFIAPKSGFFNFFAKGAGGTGAISALGSGPYGGNGADAALRRFKMNKGDVIQYFIGQGYRGSANASPGQSIGGQFGGNSAVYFPDFTMVAAGGLGGTFSPPNANSGSANADLIIPGARGGSPNGAGSDGGGGGGGRGGAGGPSTGGGGGAPGLPFLRGGDGSDGVANGTSPLAENGAGSGGSYNNVNGVAYYNSCSDGQLVIFWDL